MISQLAEHFFRHESSRLLAALCARFGTENFPLLEDAVQSALLEAMSRWRSGVPDNPAGWLYRVAHNRVLDHWRHLDTASRASSDIRQMYQPVHTDNTDAEIDARGINDEVLRLIFVVCHPTLKPRDQIMLAMKHLCGLSADEIARGLLMKPAAVKKQLQRAAARLKAVAMCFELPADSELGRRLDTVHQVLYMVFNEGYSCATGEQVIRQDVCAEAARLCHMLTEHPIGNYESRALLALMMLHAARLPARMDQHGTTILLEQQDRSLWQRDVIHEAGRWLQSAIHDNGCARADSRYVLEACIAQMHCQAKQFDSTPWHAIIACYDALIHHFDAPVYRMNRAIAVAYQSGFDQALQELEQLEQTNAKVSPISLLCARAWLHEKTGNYTAALAAAEQALQHDLAIHEWRVMDTQRQRLLALSQ